MSIRTANDLNDDTLGAALRDLPLASPSASAWPDLERALRAAGAARQPLVRKRYAIPAALAAALALFAVWPNRVQTPGGAEPGGTTTTTLAAAPAPSVERLRDESQRIEGWLRKVSASGGPLDGRDLMAATEVEDLIGLVDLQLAGANDASPDAAALWRQRVDLLRDLAAIRTNNAYSLAGNGVAANGTAAAPGTWIN
ncbi:hypothetical protein [Tahibacter soli]|uniref:Uncharacterized protein n=1 Tax=Tahibacter soli TaxID=2983605 RepID=A0A9X4BHL6_9GAMM|nr:hypothetical protein [Tahibacter soli]MDC8011232.1 hypothetical protein [Tahibacter soli]